MTNELSEANLAQFTVYIANLITVLKYTQEARRYLPTEFIFKEVEKRIFELSERLEKAANS